ncbi:MAG TPA: four-helix bundle copper-binding protein [Roseiflexaceae bacterium]|nr:four-helix bundle copper-binding protein [Roseiflexaceae bacterium]
MTQLHTTSHAMQECIDNCKECHAICVATTVHCLEMGGKHAQAAHIRTLLDCAQICATSADFMLRSSPFHAQTCGVCADVCEACATECERMAGNDEQMRRCADMCRRCAASCRSMASMAA